MQNINRWFLGIASILGASGVIAGAFAAHGIQKVIQSAYLIEVFKTAVTYQMFHALALLCIATISSRNQASKTLIWSGILMILGTLFFSGSLYLLTLFSWSVGWVTPLGGVLLILGWLGLLLAAWNRKSLEA